MKRSRVLVIGLDGLEIGLAERMMASGEMPALAELGRRAARFRLDHGPAQRTGLAWEHVASGLTPEAGRRWAAVEFDPATYTARQEGARFAPWWAGLDQRVVVFDTPYVDLRRAGPRTAGVVAWGAHDPGTSTAARPRHLLGEFEQRFGRYPAAAWTYGTPWPSPERAREMGDALAGALGVRTEAARWLASERLPEWDLFIAVAGEAHGAVEGLWHGVDPSHPLHTHASAPAAARGLRDVFWALDRMVGELVRLAGSTSVVAFATGGMGPNHSDTQSMVLLPELLHRHAFGRPLLAVDPTWAASPDTLPILHPDDSWSRSSARWLPRPPGSAPAVRPRSASMMSAIARRLPPSMRGALKGARAAAANWTSSRPSGAVLDLHWQPALRYRPHWPRMPAFALPSFYDGRIRINLRGRERHGMIDPARYEEAVSEIEALLCECRNPLTKNPAVAAIERASTRDPLALGGSEADLLVVWRDVAAALEHPRLGLIGPVPLRRTGGHTGPHGMAWVRAPGVEPGERGVRSTFDVVPTIVDLLAAPRPRQLSGSSLLLGPGAVPA
jgi:predicted AlkP superfamily phosphohydrolase/phosphomutase